MWDKLQCRSWRSTRRIPAISLSLSVWELLPAQPLFRATMTTRRKAKPKRMTRPDANWLCDLIWDLLEDWESEDCEDEDDYTDDLVGYLRDELREVRAPDDDRRIRVEKRVRTAFGNPDIIIDDRLALELKLGPHEGEKDRLIGQCCKYSVEWVTWAVVIGMSERKARQLVKLLDKKSLHYIEVIEFDLIEEDDETEDEED